VSAADYAGKEIDGDGDRQTRVKRERGVCVWEGGGVCVCS